MSIPNYPTLYNLQGNNKLYEWSIKIEKCKGSSAYLITTSHGQTEGKQITHENVIAEGKANRTSLEQAILESNRKWENKKTKELYNETPPSKSDTFSPAIVRPMLANKFSFELYKKDGRAFKIKFPAFVQKKYDGIRCLAYLKNGKVILESRKGTEFANFDVLKSQLTKVLAKLPSNFYLDGELYTPNMDFEVISGVIRLSEKNCSDHYRQLINQIEYHIYDFYDSKQPLLTCKNRAEFLAGVLNINSTEAPLCKPVETIVVNELNDVKKYHDKFVKEGYEGIMVRDMDGPYETNKRSKYLQKYKEFMEEEFKIVGFHEGGGDETGAIVWECKTDDGKIFSARPKGTVESRKQLFEDGSKYIGKLLTVIFQEYSSDGIPRFPVGKAVRENY
jgi:ATP-dependent DNA ligase